MRGEAFLRASFGQAGLALRAHAYLSSHNQNAYKKTLRRRWRVCVVGKGGFEPPKLSRQIYSLIPLTTRKLAHIVGHNGLEPSTSRLSGACSNQLS